MAGYLVKGGGKVLFFGLLNVIKECLSVTFFTHFVKSSVVIEEDFLFAILHIIPSYPSFKFPHRKSKNSSLNA